MPGARGGVTCAFSLVYLICLVVIRRFLQDMVVMGLASVTGLLEFRGGVQLLPIGILGESVGVTRAEVVGLVTRAAARE